MAHTPDVEALWAIVDAQRILLYARQQSSGEGIRLNCDAFMHLQEHFADTIFGRKSA